MPSFKSIGALCVLLLITLIPHGSASAQSDESKIEVGAQFSALGSKRGFWADDETSVGGGGRLTYNLTRYLAIEGELNYFPSTGFNDVRRFQGQFGVKSGLRFERFGVFGKARPGFIDTKYDIPVVCIQGPCPPIKVGYTGFSMDVGGVLEFYPSRRITVRFDAGDTILNRKDPVWALIQASPDRVNPPITTIPGTFFASSIFIPERNHATHNLQLSAGIGFRF